MPLFLVEPGRGMFDYFLDSPGVWTRKRVQEVDRKVAIDIERSRDSSCAVCLLWCGLAAWCHFDWLFHVSAPSQDLFSY